MNLNKNLIYLVLIIIINLSCKSMNKSSQQRPEYALVIHGGAGVITRQSMDSITEKSYREALDSVLTIGEKILADGGTSLDAVETVVAWMEDNPLFNAG